MFSHAHDSYMGGFNGNYFIMKITNGRGYPDSIYINNIQQLRFLFKWRFPILLGSILRNKLDNPLFRLEISQLREA